MNDGMDPMDAADLTERQRRLVEFVASGLSVQQAATKAGFSASYARKSSRLLKHPAIAQAVAAIRTDARREAVYGLVEAVREIDKAIVFGYSVSNPMSVAKLLELKSKLFGLLVDRVEIATVDLKGALEAARNRVVMVNAPPPQPCANQGPATDPERGPGRSE